MHTNEYTKHTNEYTNRKVHKLKEILDLGLDFFKKNLICRQKKEKKAKSQRNWIFFEIWANSEDDGTHKAARYTFCTKKRSEAQKKKRKNDQSHNFCYSFLVHTFSTLKYTCVVPQLLLHTISLVYNFWHHTN